MASTISPNAVNVNVPLEGVATTASVRANFAAIRTQFQAAVADVEGLQGAVAAIPEGPIGPVGPAGPAGPAGAAGANANIQFVVYGSVAGTARPDFPIVAWVGDAGVDPANAINGDLRFTT